jgi:hypothetical protein
VSAAAELELLIRRIVREEIAALAAATVVEKPAEEFVGAAEAAKLGGWPSRRAMDQHFHRARARGEVHPVEALADTTHGARRWLRGDLIAYAREHTRGGK